MAEKQVMYYDLTAGALKVIDRPRSRSYKGDEVVKSDTEGAELLQVRYTIEVAQPKTDKGRQLWDRWALKYMCVDAASALPIFDGKVENDLTKAEFQALNGKVLKFNPDDHVDLLEKGEREPGEGIPREYKVACDSILEQRKADGLPNTTKAGEKITPTWVRKNADLPAVAKVLADAKRLLAKKNDGLGEL